MRIYDRGFVAVTAIACERIRRGTPPQLRACRRLQLVVDTAFQPLVSWEVFEAAHGGEVVRTTWDRRVDEERLVTTSGAHGPALLEPTLHVARAAVPMGVVTEWRARLSLSVPLAAPARDPTTVTLDGTRCRVVVDNDGSRAELEWHEAGPREWGLVVEVVRAILVELTTLEWT